MDRRRFLQLGAGAAVGGCCASWRSVSSGRLQSAVAPLPPAYSVIPVVGDGKWIWTEPPKDQTGYLEPRSYRLKVGMELEGQGNSWQIKATTPVAVGCPEQKIEEERIETKGCAALVRQVGPYARQLCLAAPNLSEKQKISAIVHYKLSICKQYQGYHRDQFPEQQEISREVRRQSMGESPGIQTRCKEVRDLLEALRSKADHPWDLAAKFAKWIPRNIRAQIGSYTSVQKALQTRRGDCEEMAALFVALCRAAEIPARLVWIPNHNWAEFFLVDHEGQGHWIPAHTACYFWFGWTGVHELVIQKGDRIRLPERHRFFRLLEDWMQWGGRRPKIKYVAELEPLPPSEGADPGPGARQKIETGEWQLVGSYANARYARR